MTVRHEPVLTDTTLPAEPRSVGESRRAVRRVLGERLQAELVDVAELLVSEVVTNALVHAGTAIQLVVRQRRDGVCIEVRDGSPHLPAARRYAALAGTGRGLTLVSELASRWGVAPQPGGKTVWFELSLQTPSSEEPVDRGDATGRESGDTSRAATVDVVLEDLPLLLYEAWRQHAESLLREYLLVCLEEVDCGDDPIQVHAEASDALAVLAEHLPALTDEADPDLPLAELVGPGSSLPHARVPVPSTSVPHFARLDQALCEAVSLADRGLLLTAPTQPEIRALRRWICTEVAEQDRGRAPRAWQPDEHQPPPARAPLEWDDRSVRAAVEARIAADDTDVIVAASRAAADLLGYPQPADLVGRRLVEIIPERLRQAHLAGFTLLFLTGRAPLLGQTVTVPALCRGGAERLVELAVHAEPAPHGRRVFVADLREAPC